MWSPAGRLFQVEDAMEAIKQGSDAISLPSRIHAVLACINKVGSKLSSHQKKIFDVDNHVGVAIFGLTTDSRVLSCYMPFECIKHAFIYESPLSVIRLVVQFADKAQLLARRTEEIPIELPVCQMIFWHIGTQRSWKRPNGVGLLVAGLDESGAHLYYNCPSGNCFEYQAFAIRSCSQAAKTYLERRFENFVDSSWEDLVKDALIAIRHMIFWHVGTQLSWKRPNGVGLLVAGLDESGAHLYYNCPSGNYFEYQAFAIGSHSQAAKTYLERRFENFVDSSREDLVKDALIAIRDTLQGEKLKSSICVVAEVRVGEQFHVLDQDKVQQLIIAFELVEEEEPHSAEPSPGDHAAVEGEGASSDQAAAPTEI